MKFALVIGFCLLAASSVHAQVRAQTMPGQYAAPGTTLQSLTPANPAPPQPAPFPAPPINASGTSFAQWAGANVHPAVARIVAPGDGSMSYGSGTLVYTDERQGLVITNWHVINEATQPISVHFPDGFYSIGTVQAVDKDWDLAAIAIKRPNAQPVAMADRAPQPGEMLTIAGYGSGKYRAASGPCTQYVAPGMMFPFEMVELAASARQGDSGGPIFNSRGELAGVLFGEGNGRTSGSYCGRVRWFLAGVAPRVGEPAAEAIVDAKPLAPVPERIEPLPLASLAAASKAVEPAANASQSSDRPEAPAAFGGEQKWQAVPQPVEPKQPVVAATRASSEVETAVVGAVAATREIGWHDIAGETWPEQAKTVLAAIGVLAIAGQALRLLGRMEAA